MINFSCIPYLYNNYIYNYYIGWGYIVLLQEKLITSGACGNWFYATSIKLNMIWKVWFYVCIFFILLSLVIIQYACFCNEKGKDLQRCICIQSITFYLPIYLIFTHIYNENLQKCTISTSIWTHKNVSRSIGRRKIHVQLVSCKKFQNYHNTSTFSYDVFNCVGYLYFHVYWLATWCR